MSKSGDKVVRKMGYKVVSKIRKKVITRMRKKAVMKMKESTIRLKILHHRILHYLPIHRPPYPRIPIRTKDWQPSFELRQRTSVDGQVLQHVPLNIRENSSVV